MNQFAVFVAAAAVHMHRLLPLADLVHLAVTNSSVASTVECSHGSRILCTCQKSASQNIYY